MPALFSTFDSQMCFSSQYYMMMAVHVNGIVYFVLGVQMMIRKVYILRKFSVALLFETLMKGGIYRFSGEGGGRMATGEQCN